MPHPKDQRKIELTTLLEADPAVVWKTLTAAEELKRWFPLDARVQAGPDGWIQLYWGDDHTWRFQVKEAVLHKYLKLVYEHGAGFQGPAEPLLAGEATQLVLEYFLETENGRTALRLVHSGFGPDTNWDDEYNAVNRGWRSEMQSLQHYIAHHRGRDRRVAWSRAALPDHADPGKIWQALMQDTGQFTSNSEVYTFQSPYDEAYTGRVLMLNPPCDFSGTVERLNNAFFRVTIEIYGRHREISVWLATYGLPPAVTARFQEEWDRELQRLLNL
ncbi:SRPBCC family protein [Chitinophaga japonensis]|uniref:Uncharacterized protein YndB with AHSA1/START domain n=1 Tax=Chitinophaga japonensis TaxID=104662 RepID=A0A562SZQ4_CHIJA|nr:SRPBCC domain-containing protein [Chitinophaga japonensis]TWI86484.1 uncharacterized protein YndB with AHSA1/START domain [Chitinophaga japonensis]